MKTRKSLVRPLPPLGRPRPLKVIAPPAPVDAPRDLATPAKVAAHEADPGHRFHPRKSRADARPRVAKSGAMRRLRARLPEYHKPAPPATGGTPSAPRARTRKIHGGLVPKRRLKK